MEKHTQGRVHIWKHGDPSKMIPIVADSDPTTAMAYVGVKGWPNAENAARFAAAWNAVEDIATETLTPGSLKVLVDALEWIAECGTDLQSIRKADAALAPFKAAQEVKPNAEV